MKKTLFKSMKPLFLISTVIPVVSLVSCNSTSTEEKNMETDTPKIKPGYSLDVISLLEKKPTFASSENPDNPGGFATVSSFDRYWLSEDLFPENSEKPNTENKKHQRISL